MPHTAANAGALKPIWRSALWVLVTALSCDGRHGGKARYWEQFPLLDQIGSYDLSKYVGKSDVLEGERQTREHKTVCRGHFQRIRLLLVRPLQRTLDGKYPNDALFFLFKLIYSILDNFGI